MCIILLLKTNVKIYTGPFYGLNILRDDTGHVTFSDDDSTWISELLSRPQVSLKLKYGIYRVQNITLLGCTFCPIEIIQ